MNSLVLLLRYSPIDNRKAGKARYKLSCSDNQGKIFPDDEIVVAAAKQLGLNVMKIDRRANHLMITFVTQKNAGQKRKKFLNKLQENMETEKTL